MNGLVKIPMQFFILLIGTLVFVFYQYHQPPVFFNEVEVNNVKNSVYKDEYNKLEINYQQLHSGKLVHLNDLKKGIDTKDEELINSARTHLQTAERKEKEIKKSVTDLLVKNNSLADINDTNYVFLNFVTKNLPVGMIGLLIAIIFLASMGSTASGLNSLASTTVIDIYKRLINKDASSEFYLSFSRWATVGWGLFCVIIAVYAGKMGNLLEAVNILGSLFYGTILGIFVVAFYMKNVGGKAVFYAALITEVFVFTSWMLELTAFLWLNVIGCLLVMLFSYLLQILVFQVPKIASRN